MANWHKYKAKPTVVNGVKFASKKEAERYKDLLLLEGFGDITELELQPRFPIIFNDIKICTYVADFSYIKKGEKDKTVEDVKGFKTRVYSLKKKMMKAVHDIEILET